MYKRYVTQVWAACMRGVSFVRNVFKKKSCGASLYKSEIVFIGKTKEGFNTYAPIKSEKDKGFLLFGIRFRFLSKKSKRHLNQSIQHDLKRQFQLGHRWIAPKV